MASPTPVPRMAPICPLASVLARSTRRKMRSTLLPDVWPITCPPSRQLAGESLCPLHKSADLRPFPDYHPLTLTSFASEMAFTHHLQCIQITSGRSLTWETIMKSLAAPVRRNQSGGTSKPSLDWWTSWNKKPRIRPDIMQSVYNESTFARDRDKTNLFHSVTDITVRINTNKKTTPLFHHCNNWSW